MSEYISAEELLKRWDLRVFELYRLVRHGHLLPFDEIGKEIYNPILKTKLDTLDKMKERLFTGKISEQDKKQLRAEIRHFKDSNDLFGWGWGTHDPPSDREGEKEIITTIGSCLYLWDHVKKIEKNEELAKWHNIRVPEKDESDYSEHQQSIEDEILSKNEDLIYSIGEEAERIYRYIVRKIGATDKSLTSRTERKNCALEYFRKKECEFKYIKQEHLTDLDIFDFRSHQSKRDFMRRLFKIVLEDIFPGKKFPGSKAFNFYKLTNRPS